MPKNMFKNRNLCYDIYGDLEMNGMTLLRREQIFGDKQLDIIKKYGTKCAVTDFSILLGVAYSDNNYTKDGKDTKDKKERSGWWWTRTPYLESPSRVYVVADYGGDDDDAVYERYNGGRPVLPYSLIKAISSNEVIGKYGIKEIECGEYPQTIVDETLSKELEKCYNEDVPFEVDLVKSGKVYTTDSVDYNDPGTKFEPITYDEYIYKGKKYIRVVASYNGDHEILSDGREIECGKPYWISVEPIKWLVDERAILRYQKRFFFQEFNSNMMISMMETLTKLI